MFPRKDLFALPEGIVYLNGNSLGPLPKSVTPRVEAVLTQEWGKRLILGWSECRWMEQPIRVGNQVARIIGAPSGSVVMGDTLSIKIYQALAAALEMRPKRKVVLSDTGNFPSDLYIARGLLSSLDKGHELRTVAPGDIPERINAGVATVMLTETDYRTGRRHDMESVSRAARDAGAVMIWDLAHSAGAFPVDVAGCGCEFAVGCTYKFLNGGPGAPAFIYIRPDLTERAVPALSGWLGHETPFAFEADYRPASSIERMRVGTPPVIQMTALEEAMRIWENLDMDELHSASIALSELFIAEVEARCDGLSLAGPRDPALRGSQVSFTSRHGEAVIQALANRGVIGDFRAPDTMRFGIAPLYLDETDILAAVDALEDIMSSHIRDGRLSNMP